MKTNQKSKLKNPFILGALICLGYIIIFSCIGLITGSTKLSYLAFSLLISAPLYYLPCVLAVFLGKLILKKINTSFPLLIIVSLVLWRILVKITDWAIIKLFSEHLFGRAI